MHFKKTILLAFSSLVLFSSCEKNDDKTSAPLTSFENGVLVLNQGNFGAGNAAVSFVTNDFSIAQDGLFSTANPNIILGDTAQDMGFYNDYLGALFAKNHFNFFWF